MNWNRVTKYFSPVFPRLLIVARLSYGAIFLVSSFTKFADPGSFQQALTAFGMFPSQFIPLLVVGIPIVEFCIGLLVMIGVQISIVCQTSAYLLALFTAVLVPMIATGTDVSCGCFGSLSSGKVDGWTIIRNLVLMGWAIVLEVFYTISNEVRQENPNKSGLLGFGHLWMASKGHFVRTLTVCFFLTLLSSSIVLSIQNRALKNRLSLIVGQTSSLSIGDTVKAFEVLSMEGVRTNVSFTDNRRTLIFVMRPGCGPCRDNLPLWKKLERHLRGSEVSVIGVCVDSLHAARQFAHDGKIDFPLFSTIGRSFVEDFKILATPQTILVQGQRVTMVWKGLLNDDVLYAIDQL